MEMCCSFNVVKKPKWQLHCVYMHKLYIMRKKYHDMYSNNYFMPKRLIKETRTLEHKMYDSYNECEVDDTHNEFNDTHIIHKFLSDTIGKHKSNWGVEKHISISYNDIQKIIKCAKDTYKNEIAEYIQNEENNVYGKLNNIEKSNYIEKYRDIKDIVNLIYYLEGILENCCDKNGKFKKDYMLLYYAS